MKTRIAVIIGMLMLASLIIAACSPQMAVDEGMAKEEMAPEPMEEKTDESMESDKEDMAGPEPMDEMADEEGEDMEKDEMEEDSDHGDGEMMEEKDGDMEAEDGDMMDTASMDAPA